MAEDRTDSTAQSGKAQPAGYWVVKILVIALIGALAIIDLRTEGEIPILIYTALVALAGGPELAAAVGKGR